MLKIISGLNRLTFAGRSGKPWAQNRARYWDGGPDPLEGGAAQLTGGAGADIFVYATAGDSPAALFDAIADFTSGTDTPGEA